MSIRVQRVDYRDESDRKNLIRLIGEYIRFELGHEPPHVQGLPDQLADFPTAFSVLAFDDSQNGDAIGLINCMFGFSTFKGKRLVNIHDVIVTESHRGKGIASKMLNLVEQIALEADCCRLTLEVYEDNPAARRAYEKYGFTGDPVHPDVHTLFLRKSIGS